MKLKTLEEATVMTIDNFFAAINTGNALTPESHTTHPPASAEMIEEWRRNVQNPPIFRTFRVLSWRRLPLSAAF
jgi:hypothetical protein